MLCLYGTFFPLVQSDSTDRSLRGQSGPVTMRLKGKHLSNGGHDRYLQTANEFETDDIFYVLWTYWWSYWWKSSSLLSPAAKKALVRFAPRLACTVESQPHKCCFIHFKGFFTIKTISDKGNGKKYSSSPVLFFSPCESYQVDCLLMPSCGFWLWIFYPGASLEKGDGNARTGQVLLLVGSDS